MDDSQKWLLVKWYLLKHEDGTVFGPVRFDQLKQWALEAQISPFDKISTDERTWVKAPMIPELEMDYLVEVSADQYYGPTTVGAVREFLEAGEISADTIITNCKDGSEQMVRDMPGLISKSESEPEQPAEPVRTSVRVSLQARVRELEEMLMDERRAREMVESQLAKLEARLGQE